MKFFISAVFIGVVGMFLMSGVCSAAPIFVTEAKDKNNNLIYDGGVLDLEDIEAGDFVTIHSVATVLAPDIIINHKIRWWKNNALQVPVDNWNNDGGVHSITISGPLSDGDFIEYQVEATDNSFNTFCDPDNPVSCGIPPYSERYSFTVKKIKKWAKAYGGANSDILRSIAQTSDDGYLLSGYSDSFPGADNEMITTKINSDGDELWTKTIIGPNNDYSSKIISIAGDKFVIAGSLNLGSQKSFMAKLSADGSAFDWAKSYSATGWDIYTFTDIKKTNDDNYILSGFSNVLPVQLGFVSKIDAANGNLLWIWIFDDAVRFNTIKQLPNGDYIAVGSYNNDVIITEISQDGSSVNWTKTYPGIGDTAYSVDLVDDDGDGTQDDGFIVAGVTKYGLNPDNIFVIKIKSDGTKDWAKVYGGTGNEFAESIQQIDGNGDGIKDGYIVVGETDSEGGGGTDFFILKLKQDGIKDWVKTFGGPGDDSASFVSLTSDSGYIIGGKTDSFGAGSEDLMVLKIDSSENTGFCPTSLQNGTLNLLLNEPSALTNYNGTAPALINNPALLTSTDVSGALSIAGQTSIENTICFNAPTVTPLPIIDTDYCVSHLPGGISLSWTFTDIEDGAAQTRYKINLDRSDSAPTCTITKNPNALSIITGIEINALCADFINYGNFTYTWDIEVYDSDGANSGPVAGENFPNPDLAGVAEPTPLHRYPTANFSYSPFPPPTLLQLQEITFDPNTSIRYDNFNNSVPSLDGGLDFEWNLGDGTVPNPTSNPLNVDGGLITHFYSNEGTFVVNLEVTDSTSGYACPTSQTLTIDKNTPGWNETTP